MFTNAGLFIPGVNIALIVNMDKTRANRTAGWDSSSFEEFRATQEESRALRT
jgi:hypothetical protein